MTTYFDKISRCWAPRKSKLMKNRPQPSFFSFTVCMAVVFSFCFGFSGGYISALSNHPKDYGSVRQGLLEELENTEMLGEREHARHSRQGIALARSAKWMKKVDPSAPDA